MAATRRLQKELADLQKSDKPEILKVKDLGPANDQILKWNGTIFPEKVDIFFFRKILTCRLLGALQQGCIHRQLRISRRVSVQTAKSHFQNANLSSKC